MLIIAMIVFYYILKFKIRFYLFVLGLLVDALSFILFALVIIGLLAGS